VTTASASFRLNAGAAVSLSVYDVSGRRVAGMVSGDLEQGSHSFVWDATSEPSGVYLMVLRAGGSVATAKVVRASL
jgi:flagellar hook assembly protein FlgD